MRWASCLAVFLVLSMSAAAQDVIVSEYFKVAGPFGQGTEILVVKDDISLVGWVLTDNNTDQTERQGGVKFKDVPLWRHLRAGTIIVVWHRGVVPKDADHRDGYIEIEAQNRVYFDAFPDDSYFNPINGAAMNIAATGDILELLDASGTHVHGLGHKVTTGVYYDTMSPPKVNTLSACNNGQSNMVVGRTLAAYAADRTTDSSRVGLVINPDTSLGFPNLHANVDDRNVRFWSELREPTWSASPTITITQQLPASHTFSWTPITEPYAADSVQGYMIVRDTLDFATAPSPVDGTIYVAGDRLGSARILAVRPTIDGTSYTDTDNIVCGGRYTYRVFAYRFRKDDRRPVTPPATTRGRQYTAIAARSVQIIKAVPAPPTITANVTSICPGDAAILSTTAVAQAYYWFKDGVLQVLPNNPSVTVREAGTWSLQIVAEGGCTANSNTVQITVKPAPSVDIIPATEQRICAGDTVVLRTTVAATSYEWFRNGQIIPGETADSLRVLTAGQYFVRASVTNGCPGISVPVTVSIRSITATLSTNAIDFGTLGECESSSLRSVTITNTSSEAITLAVASMPTGFALSSPPPGTVMQPGATLELRFRFTPPGTGTYSGTALIRMEPCDVEIGIALQGSKSTPSVSVDKALVDFGTYTTCSDVPGIGVDSVFRIVNGGTSDVIVRAPVVAPPFFVAGTFPRTVGPGGSTEITVQYAPLGADADRGVSQDIAFPFESLSCRDTLRSTVTAAAFRARAELADDTVNVGTVSSCSPATRARITVRNTGGASLTVNSVTHPGVTIIGAPISIAPYAEQEIDLDVDLSAEPAGPFFVVGDITIEPCALRLRLTLRGVIDAVTASVVDDDVSMGTLTECDAVTSIDMPNKIVMSDSLTAGATITSVTSTAPEFTTSLLSGMTFTGVQPFTITYSPIVPGDHVGEIVVILGPCPDTLRIRVTGSMLSVAPVISQNSTDFGMLTPGQSSQRIVLVVNTGTASLRVEPPAGIVPPFFFAGSSAPLPTDLAAGDSVTYTVEYRHSGTVSDDTLALTTTVSWPCSVSVTTQFIGRSRDTGTTAPLAADVVIPTTLTGRPGVTTAIPVHLRAGGSLTAANATQLQIDISYDPTLLLPRTVTAKPGITAVLNVTGNGNATITLTAAVPLEATDSLALVESMVYLGNAPSTPITIDRAVATGLDLTGRDGLLTLEGPCLLSALRAGVGGPVAITMRGHHAGTFDVEISTLTHDAVQIDVFSSTGVWMGTVLDQRLQPGAWAIPVHTAHLPTGLYFLRMVHGRFVRTLGIFAE